MGFFSRIQDAQQASAAQVAHGQANTAAAMAEMGAQMPYMQTANRLAQAGVEAPGVVHTIGHTGERELGGSEKIEFEVSIRPAGAEPYQTTIRQSMLPAQLESLAEGQAITVRYDPDAPQVALIYGW